MENIEKNNKDIGIWGEEQAVLFLEKNGYKIIERNFRKKWGEIDIIAFDKKTKEHVFIEVKTRVIITKDSLLPEEELTTKKIKRLKKAFLSYLSKNNLENKPWRFDLIAIKIYKSDLTGEHLSINHYKDIFINY
ncbi:MAG: YraN family protein [Candidatus Pacebacteria bacterium]|nr:YraN family protein [Candidatus Paceibacterota bacterium]